MMKIDKWYLVETADGAEIGFGAPNAKTGLTMTGGSKLHRMAWAQYIIGLHEKAEDGMGEMKKCEYCKIKQETTNKYAIIVLILFALLMFLLIYKGC